MEEQEGSEALVCAPTASLTLQVLTLVSDSWFLWISLIRFTLHWSLDKSRFSLVTLGWRRNLVRFCKYAWMCNTWHACVATGAEPRGGRRVSCSTSLYPAPLQQGISLNIFTSHFNSYWMAWAGGSIGRWGTPIHKMHGSGIMWLPRPIMWELVWGILSTIIIKKIWLQQSGSWWEWIHITEADKPPPQPKTRAKMAGGNTSARNNLNSKHFVLRRTGKPAAAGLWTEDKLDGTSKVWLPQ